MADQEARGIPEWAVNLLQQVTAINERTSRLPEIEKQIENLRATAVPMQEYLHLATRVDTLWDAYNASKGIYEARLRMEKVWRYGLATAISILALVEAWFRTGGHF